MSASVEVRPIHVDVSAPSDTFATDFRNRVRLPTHHFAFVRSVNHVSDSDIKSSSSDLRHILSTCT